MDRRLFLKVASSFSAATVGFQQFNRFAGSQELPEGIPAGSQKARVRAHIDGDKFEVSIGDARHTVLLISANAPEPDKCFFEQSSNHLQELLPVGELVYLEPDGEDKDGKDRLLRYVWKPREGQKAQFVDERMIADGFSTFSKRDGHSKRDSRLKKAEDLAKEEKRGLWADDACVVIPDLGSAENPAPIGTMLKADGQEITLLNAYFTNSFGYSTPKGGYTFIVVEVSITNLDDENHGYDESRFAAKDLDTNADFDDTFTLADQPLGYGELSPGAYVYGQVVLEVQETARRVRIKYDTKFVGGGEVYWIITR